MRSRRPPLRVAAALVGCLSFGAGLGAQAGAARPAEPVEKPAGSGQWSQFRGPGGQGVAVGDRRPPVEFGRDRGMRFRVEVSPGNSSPCVWGDRVFLTGARDRQLETVCLDAATGAERWRRSVEVEVLEKGHRINSAASPTPAADGARVVVYFGSFGLLCYDHDGEEVWRRPLPAAANTFGTAASPVIDGEHVILVRDTNEASWVEVMRATDGETLWRVDRSGFPSAWSTPVVWRRGDAVELLVYGAFRLTAYDLATGDERWSVPGLADEPCITPALGEELVYVTSYNMRTNPEVVGLPSFETLLAEYDDDGNGTLSRREVGPNRSILSRMDADGEGDHPLRGFFRFLDRDADGQLSAAEWQRMFDWLSTFEHRNAVVAIRPPDAAGGEVAIAWQFGRGIPECPSPLVHEGKVYLVKNGGMVSCLDAATGALHYQGRLGAGGPRYSSPVVGGGRIYAASARGVITVFAAGDTLDVLAHNDLGERIMATPALVDGVIYVRTEAALYAFAEP